MPRSVANSVSISRAPIDPIVSGWRYHLPTTYTVSSAVASGHARRDSRWRCRVIEIENSVCWVIRAAAADHSCFHTGEEDSVRVTMRYSSVARVCLAGLILFGGTRLVLGAGRAAPADVRTKEMPFKHDGKVVQGLVGWNDQVQGKRPGVIVIHSLWGYNNHVREQVTRLAESGYVGYAFDMGGSGSVETHVDHDKEMSRQNAGIPAQRVARFAAAMEQLKHDPHVDPNRISAIGYCWGGAVVLDMARAGVTLDSVVSFHGTLSTQTPAQKGQVKSRVLVLTGELDPYAAPKAVETLRKEMTEAGATFEIVTYPGIMHAFTEPYAKEEIVDLGGTPARGVDRGIKYSAEADNQSWAAMLKLFKEMYP
jgi:dienelactone hydrolase